MGIRAFFTDLLTGKSREAAFRQEMEAVYDSSEYQAISECIFDMNIGITDGNEKNGRVRKCIIRQAAEKILVIDKTKLNLKKFYKISGFEMIDKVVIDGFYSDEQRDIWEQFLNQTHTKLIVAK